LRPQTRSLAAAFHHLRRWQKKTPHPDQFMVRVVWNDWQREPAMCWLINKGRPMMQGWRQPVGRHNDHCWTNSWARRSVEADFGGDDYAYAEGVAAGPAGVGWHYDMHGWNMRRGHVWDGTWGRDHAARYWGVVFSDEFLRFAKLVAGHDHNFLNHFGVMWPYLDNYTREWHATLKRPA
jgi:hypothetical protein